MFRAQREVAVLEGFAGDQEVVVHALDVAGVYAGGEFLGAGEEMEGGALEAGVDGVGGEEGIEEGEGVGVVKRGEEPGDAPHLWEVVWCVFGGVAVV